MMINAHGPLPCIVEETCGLSEAKWSASYFYSSLSTGSYSLSSEIAAAKK